MAAKNLKNITFSADKALIEQARNKATENHTTLNDAFREWLEQFVRPASTKSEFRELMVSLSKVRSGKKFSRDEMNER